MSNSSFILKNALKFHEEGRFHAAANLLLDGFHEDPQNVSIARQLGIVLHAVGDSEGAVDFLSRAYQSNPSDAETIAELVLVLHELERYDDASAVLMNGLNAGIETEAFATKLRAA
jgi:Flp pilus assembly protein TadD